MSRLEKLSQEYCPNGVKYIEIDRVCKTVAPLLKIKSNDYLKNGLYPVIDQGKDLIGGYTNEEVCFPQSQYVVFGDHTCVVKYVDFPFVQGADGVKVLKADEECVIPRFLYHCMTAIKLDTEYKRHWSIMRKEEIPLPPIPVQQEIVHILDSFTDYKAELEAELEARKKQYEYYRDMLLATDYESVKLKEICESIRDGMHNLPTTTTEMTEYPILSAQNINNGRIDYTAKRYVSKDVFDFENKRTNVSKGDVLLTIVATIGRTAVVQDDKKCLLQRSVCVLKPKPSITSEYLKYCLDTKSLQQYMMSNAHGSAQAGLYLNQVAEMEIPLPPLDVQKKIASTISSFDEMCTSIAFGLPAEIEARQKQYEYYRDKLLTFTRKES